MTELAPQILEQIVEGSAEPIFVARIDHPDWPVVLANTAFGGLTDFMPVVVGHADDVGADEFCAVEVGGTVQNLEEGAGFCRFWGEVGEAVEIGDGSGEELAENGRSLTPIQLSKIIVKVEFP